jgi:hypothetical protein
MERRPVRGEFTVPLSQYYAFVHYLRGVWCAQHHYEVDTISWVVGKKRRESCYHPAIRVSDYPNLDCVDKVCINLDIVFSAVPTCVICI